MFHQTTNSKQTNAKKKPILFFSCLKCEQLQQKCWNCAYLCETLNPDTNKIRRFCANVSCNTGKSLPKQYLEQQIIKKSALIVCAVYLHIFIDNHRLSLIPVHFHINESMNPVTHSYTMHTQYTTSIYSKFLYEKKNTFAHWSHVDWTKNSLVPFSIIVLNSQILNIQIWIVDTWKKKHHLLCRPIEMYSKQTQHAHAKNKNNQWLQK